MSKIWKICLTTLSISLVFQIESAFANDLTPNERRDISQKIIASFKVNPSCSFSTNTLSAAVDDALKESSESDLKAWPGKNMISISCVNFDSVNEEPKSNEIFVDSNLDSSNMQSSLAKTILDLIDATKESQKK